MCDCEYRVHQGIRCGAEKCHCHHPQPEVDYQLKAKILVVNQHNTRVEDLVEIPLITVDDVYVVWFSKTLQNWKALLSTTVGNGLYYEVTYNGDKAEAYIDTYQKSSNVCVEDR